ncbi:coiled-coil domain-containing protein 60-like [Dendronephthya gigantea]|uniref:coiled-coil domain-containing protein 60-like n=1 Tax=Dendronephthya gigantea TaxID=151771 RepID=UPI00106B4DF4|nr:coiled-coil domain-containing protein 60-like [Dendronephthya gigantea]
MTTLEDPRNYVASKPVSEISHKGLRVSARSSLVYTCSVPERREVAKQNYVRRNHQMQKCGYNSVSYKPYKTLGKVYLEDKNLILVALGQKDDKINASSENIDLRVIQEPKLENNEHKSKTKTVENEEKADWKLTSESQVQFLSFKSTEKLENIQSQLSKGRKMINAVRLGFNLFRLIKEEKQRKADEAEVERQRKLDNAKSSMKIISPSESSDESDDEEERSNVKFEEISDLKSSHDDAIPLDYLSVDTNFEVHTDGSMSISGRDTPATALKSRSAGQLYQKRKPRISSMRPYSPVFSNISSPNLDCRESLFRQLCALNWILDAMSQDVFPPVVSPITNCWNIKDLLEESRISRRKVERQRQSESNWQTLLVNPSRFSQRSNRKGARRISVHPQHLQRLSAVTSSSSNTLAVKSSASPVEPKTRLASVSSTDPAVESSETPVESEKNISENVNMNDETKTVAGTREEKSKNVKEKRLVKMKSFTMNNNTPEKNQPKQRSSVLSQEELNRLISSEVGENSSKKAESRVRAWVRQTDQRNAKTKFLTAALSTFGAIRMSNSVAEIPSEMRRRFSEVTEERNVLLHDKLERQNKRRWHILQRKFIRLGSSNHIRDALEKIRNDSFSDEPVETGEEMRQRVSEECEWYKDLIDNFPEDIKNDRYISIVLNKIAQYGSLEGRKVSVQHFLKIMATLRPWEVCYPEIAAAIEFVRENIVGFSTVEYDDWFTSWNPIKQRSSSAPVPS